MDRPKIGLREIPPNATRKEGMMNILNNIIVSLIGFFVVINELINIWNYLYQIQDYKLSERLS